MTTASEPSPRGSHHVEATYPDMRAARHAIARLEEHGIAASDIRLLGDAAAQARHGAESATADRAVGRHAVRSALLGLAVGAAGGGLVGAAIGLIGFGLGGLGLLGSVVAGALGGGYYGLILGGVARIKQSDAWELTYQPVEDGEVTVAVRTQDAEAADVADRTLGQLGPLSADRRNEAPSRGLDRTKASAAATTEQRRVRLATREVSPSNAAVAGHPIHAMLIPLPIASLTAVVVTDVMALVTDLAFWAAFSRFLLTFGVLTGVLAATVGAMDYFTVSTARRAVGRVHAVGNALALVVATVNLSIRLADVGGSVSAWEVGLSALAAAALAVTGWAGGELVYRHGVGVTGPATTPRSPPPRGRTR